MVCSILGNMCRPNPHPSLVATCASMKERRSCTVISVPCIGDLFLRSKVKAFLTLLLRVEQTKDYPGKITFVPKIKKHKRNVLKTVKTFHLVRSTKARSPKFHFDSALYFSRLNNLMSFKSFSYRSPYSPAPVFKYR